MKTIPEITNIINTELVNRQKRIKEVIHQLQALKNKNEVTEEMKVSLIKFAAEIQEHKGVITALENLLQKIGS